MGESLLGVVGKTDNEARWPRFSEEELLAVAKVLSSGRVNYWTGNESELFEKEFVRYFGLNYGVAVANGTVSLEIGLQALGVGLGDEVIVPRRSFFASAAAISRLGAVPVFVDVDPAFGNITVESYLSGVSPKTKAVICVHLGGVPAPMKEICELAEANGHYVVEDCAQAHGAHVNGQYVGSFGDVASWSFCQDKIISTGGEGGFISAKDEAVYRRCWSLKDHGKSLPSGAVYKKGHFRWLHDEIGTNARMTEIQATLGRLQLKRLPELLEGRSQVADKIWSKLSKSEFVDQDLSPNKQGRVWYRLYFYLAHEVCADPAFRDGLLELFSETTLRLGTGPCPDMSLEAAYKRYPFRSVGLGRVADSSCRQLMVDVHPYMDKLAVEQELSELVSELSRAASE